MSTTWLDRLKEALGPDGYRPKLRRCLQSVVLYEALRCTGSLQISVVSRTEQVRGAEPINLFPQPRGGERKKQSFLRQAEALIRQLDFLSPSQRDEILWRTGTSKLPLDAEIAWRRAKSVEKELHKLAIQIQPFLAPHRSHQESVDLMVRSQHDKHSTSEDPAAVAAAAASGASLHRDWEPAHNHVLFAFRMYYRGDAPDPDFPDPVDGSGSADAVLLTEGVPPNRGASSSDPTHGSPAVASPPPFLTHQYLPHPHYAGGPVPVQSPAVPVPVPLTAAPSSRAAVAGMGSTAGGPPCLGSGGSRDGGAVPQPGEERRRLLSEVREHLEILKEFQGVVSDEEIARRKRLLFRALPPPPSPAALEPVEGGSSSPSEPDNTAATAQAPAGSTTPPSVKRPKRSVAAL